MTRVVQQVGKFPLKCQTLIQEFSQTHPGLKPYVQLRGPKLQNFGLKHTYLGIRGPDPSSCLSQFLCPACFHETMPCVQRAFFYASCMLYENSHWQQHFPYILCACLLSSEYCTNGPQDFEKRIPGLTLVAPKIGWRVPNVASTIRVRVGMCIW